MEGIRYKLLRKRHTVYLLFIALVLLPFNHLTAQDQSSRPTRQSSLEAFSKGSYEQAYREFSQLLEIYPQDPMYKYYCGVCLVRLERDPENAATLLYQAQQSKAIVRTVPADALFWLGRAQQMTGKYEDAIVSYNAFSEVNGKKAARELGIPDFIQQCERGEGIILPDVTDNKENIPYSEEEIKEDKPEAENEGIAIAEPPEAIVEDYDRMLSEAFEFQHKADSLYGIAEEKRKGLTTGSYTERTNLKSEISEIEKTATAFQELADNKFDEAQEAMNSKPFTGEHISVQPVSEASDTSLTADDPIDIPAIEKPAEKTVEMPPDTIKTKVDTIAPHKVQVYYHFEVREEADEEKIPVDPELPDGLLYRIQVAVFRNPVSASYFKGLTPLFGFRVAGRDLTIYYTGLFRRYADAGRALVTVQKKGFKDAFISAFLDGVAVSRERAAALEKKWGKIPLMLEQEEPVLPADTLPPTLTFRIEVARSQEMLVDEDVDDFLRVAGSRGLEVITLPNGDNVYLIGTFITWDSAEEYADLLIRNGYTEAKVGAWLGKREIPVETARELFEMLE